MNGRIGFIAAGWSPDPGGVEVVTAGLARELIALGFELHALALDCGEGGEPFELRSELRDGVALRRIRYRYHDHERLVDLVDHPRMAQLATDWARETQLDLVHIHHLTGFGLGTIHELKRLGLPLVKTLHDYWSLCPRGQMFDRQGESCSEVDAMVCAPCIAATWPHLLDEGDRAATKQRLDFALRALGAIDLLLAPSDAVRRVYHQAGLAKAIELNVNGIEAPEVQLEQGAGEGLRCLAVLGAVQPSKGVLELAQHFLRAAPAHWRLEVHGPLPSYHGDGSYCERLKGLAAGSTRIELRGAYQHGQLGAILRGVDAVAVPSRWEEAFGLTAREALAAGKPVLASEVGGLVDLKGAELLPPRCKRRWRAALAGLDELIDRSPPPTAPRGFGEMAAELLPLYEELLSARRQA